MSIHRFRPSGALAAILLLVLALPFVSVSAKSRYVEKWGSDTNSPDCKKTTPCFNISSALAASGKNDKIIVGPGTYYVTAALPIDIAGLRLESTAGRYATTVEQVNASQHVISITAPKVQFGRKGKGFTVSGGYGVSSAAIHIDTPESVPAIRIEGNRIGLPRPVDAASGTSSRSNYFGVNVVDGGEKLQFSFNLVHNNLVPFTCSDCDGMLARHNRVTNNLGSGFSISNSSSVTFRDNVISNNANNGILTSMMPTKLRLQNNVLEYNSIHGLDLQSTGDVSLGSIISSRNSSSGIALNQSVDASPANVKHFLSLDNANTGLFLNHTDGARIENNMALSNGTDGIHLGSNAEAKSLRNNTTISNVDCELRGVDDLVRYEYSKHFFVPDSNDTCDGDFSGSEVNRPAKININRARGLVGG